MSAAKQLSPTRERAIAWVAQRPIYLDIPMNLHRASADAELTRQLVHHIAGGQQQ